MRGMHDGWTAISTGIHYHISRVHTGTIFMTSCQPSGAQGLIDQPGRQRKPRPVGSLRLPPILSPAGFGLHALLITDPPQPPSKQLLLIVLAPFSTGAPLTRPRSLLSISTAPPPAPPAPPPPVRTSASPPAVRWCTS